MALILSFVTFFIIAFCGNWLSSRMAGNKVSKNELFITSLTFPVIIIISYLNRPLEVVLRKFLGGIYVDYGIDESYLSGTAALILYPIIYFLIGVSVLVLLGFLIKRILFLIQKKNVEENSSRITLKIYFLGLFCTILIIRILHFTGFIE